MRLISAALSPLLSSFLLGTSVVDCRDLCTHSSQTCSDGSLSCLFSFPVSHLNYFRQKKRAAHRRQRRAALPSLICFPDLPHVTSTRRNQPRWAGHLGMPYGDPPKSRYSDSLEGLSAVDKVAQFSQAVGRVSGGRGSAILIALIDSTAQLIDTSSIGRSGNTGNSGTKRSPGLAHRHHRDGNCSTQRAQQLNNSVWGAGRPDASHCSTQPQSPPALGVLLTTSHVLRSPQDMANASVCFLDQPSVGMAALLGREPRPVHVGFCSSFGFVSSVAAPKKKREYTCQTATAAAACRLQLDDEPDYLFYAAAADDSEEDEDEAEEIGFTVTYCEVFPTHDDATHSMEPSRPLKPSRSGVRHVSRAENATPSPSGRVSRYGGVGLSKKTNGVPASPSESALPQERGAKEATSNATYASRGPQWSQLASEAANKRVCSTQDSLCQVQPLPLPLLLSAIPVVKVGDIHLMITHVNDGRRSYRVKHVTAVFADYCLYEPTRFGEVTCSGGPVFNMEGDFIGVQHERNGESLCLLIKSIVRHLFDAGLLGMCRVPISGKMAKQREAHAWAGDAAFSAMSTRVPVFSATNRISPLKGDFPVSLHRTGVAAAGEDAGREGYSASSNRLPALSPCSKNSVPPPRTEGCFTADATGTTMAPPLATMPRSGSLCTLHNQPGNSAADSSLKSIRASKDGAGVEDAVTAAALPLTSPSKPLTQCTPSFEEVFAEFFDGADSLPYMLYAFPHCVPLVRLIIESVAQLKREDDLDRIVAVGGVGAILEVIDGYPHEEQIVGSSLAALCRICLYKQNLSIFLHLDGVVTVMEIMKEYVRQQAVLQWGICTLLSATDISCPSAAASAEVMVRSDAPELLVNVLRVHGEALRKRTTRKSQYHHLIRWDCDLIANLLMTNPRVTTLFLREDFLTLLLQFTRDCVRDAFLMEGFSHVFCVFVQCFNEADEPLHSRALQATLESGFRRYPPMSSSDSSRESLLPELSVHRGVSSSNDAAHSDGADHACSGGKELSSSLAPSTLSFYSPNTIATSPHKVSFFFLCDTMSRDTDGCLARAVLDVCEAALDPKNSITTHRGRSEVVLMRCLETLRLLLTWGLVQFPRGEAMLLAIEGLTFHGPTSTPTLPLTCFPAPSSPRSLPSFLEDTVHLLRICERVRREPASSSALVAKSEAVQRLILQGSPMPEIVCARA
ncbi:hypothetical protein, conserved [Leishmania tarentolae]|uniref:Uncharacterized protein n=1 Tax=Leishmania tarentolae TaxID=5689 RepID=A0A640KJM0_LEITA|nr:hypothetical protein, conserved [Leishmania tarentolae]